MMFPRCFALVCMTWSLLTTSAAFGFFVPTSVVGAGSVVAAHRASSAVVGCGPILNHQRRGQVMKLTLNMSAAEGDDGESFGAKAMRERTNAELQEMVTSHNILAFIKGNRLMPQCGYSGTLVNILQSLSVPFETVDVLADERIRQGIKDFSDWPTIPQLYLGGEFVGGADIVIELFQSGELQEMIEVAAAS